MEITGGSLDELLRKSYKKLLKKGRKIFPTKGECLELIDVVLKLRNPRARFSGTEKRGAVLFSALGETLWCFSGSNKLSFIEYYIPKYRKYINAANETKIASGAYGPRLFGGGWQFEEQDDLFEEKCQVQTIINGLNNGSDTRRAVIQIFDKSDLEKSKGDVPCTCMIQLICRENKLHMIVYMRSNDAYRGLPHDVFVFTFLQEYIARSTNKGLGEYSHHIGSFHIYIENKQAVSDFITEEQTEKIMMPSMPKGNPYPAIRWLLEREKEIRSGRKLPNLDAANMNPYWIDIARILLIKHFLEKKQKKEIIRVGRKMHSPVYGNFIKGRAEKIKEGAEQSSLF